MHINFKYTFEFEVIINYCNEMSETIYEVKINVNTIFKFNHFTFATINSQSIRI